MAQFERYLIERGTDGIEMLSGVYAGVVRKTLPMRATVLFAVAGFAAATCAFAAAAPSSQTPTANTQGEAAVDQTASGHPRPPTNVAGPRTGTNAPMTEAQCKGLGGVVQHVGVSWDCWSGNVCVTTDKNRIVHSVCLERE